MQLQYKTVMIRKTLQTNYICFAQSAEMNKKIYIKM